MIDATLQRDLLAQLAQMPEELQRHVLDFARALGPSTPRGLPGNEVRKLAGSITPDEAKEMLQAIEEHCERVNPDEW